MSTNPAGEGHMNRYVALACAVVVAALIYTLSRRPEILKAVKTRPAPCSAADPDLFDHPEIKIRIIFGYKDARPARFVGDRYERAFVIQKLIDFGFSRSAGDDDLFVWQDSSSTAKRTIELRIAHSSVGPDDHENRKNARQLWQSRYAEDQYLTGIKESDVVIYVGHSRAGGGPDFYAPRLIDGDRIDFRHYKTARSGVLKTIGALKKPTPNLKLLGLYSCESSRHFTKTLLAASPRLRIQGSTTLLYYMESLNLLIDFLGTAVQPRCPPGNSTSG